MAIGVGGGDGDDSYENVTGVVAANSTNVAGDDAAPALARHGIIGALACGWLKSAFLWGGYDDSALAQARRHMVNNPNNPNDPTDPTNTITLIILTLITLISLITLITLVTLTS